MATNAMYSITSELNHPLLTENSPSTRPAITLNGVLSIFGVLTAANFSPSMASSNIKNCASSGIFGSSCSMIKSKDPGTHSGLFINNRKVGVMM